jgi:short subunit dehydrogenase-like uncharacterized protein
MSHSREFDVIIWGATGFTGRLVAEYIFNKYGTNNDLKWAMAARNEIKLEKVRASVADETVPLIIADSNDEASLDAMTKRTKVVCTTVGPYAKYGSKLVAACVSNQTNYCDLAGESQWISKMIDAHHDAAKANGTKIVNSCGFDSIPSDMGVYFVQKQAKAKTGSFAKQIKMRVKAMKGGISGGTYASMSNLMEEASKDKNILKEMSNPYSLNPKGEQDGLDKPDLRSVIFDKTAKSWISPFVMAGINTRIVRRSHALIDFSYGKNFQYDEAVMSGKGFSGRMKGIGGVLPLALFALAKPGSFLKRMMDNKLPKPGEGPNEKQRETGFYNLRFYTILENDAVALGKVTGDRDPGYGSTSKMIAESAICLAKDELADIGGILTPASAMGDALLNRLEDNAGLTFSFELK